MMQSRGLSTEGCLEKQDFIDSLAESFGAAAASAEKAP